MLRLGEDAVMEVLEVARALLENYALCDSCLGRQFALLAHGLTNQERGKAVKLLLTVEGHKSALKGDEKGKKLLRSVAINGFSDTALQTLKIMGVEVEEPKRSCYLCGGLFNSIMDIAEHAAKKLSEYEYETFLVGVEAPANVEEREDELRAKFNVKWGEGIRNELSREIGKCVAEIAKKATDYKRPDILVLVNPFIERVTLQVNPLFVIGRYRKLVRGMPQTKWVCRECGGKGCPRCNWTGKMYPESVEEWIAKPFLEATEGSSVKFHAAGREDVDTKVLGSGRPFVIEVKKPKKRRLDLEKLEKDINDYARGKVEVAGLKFSSKKIVRKIKMSGQAEKVYRAIIEFEKNVSDDALSDIEKTLNDRPIQQLTPLRVLHRRSQKTRERHIYEVKVRRLKPDLVEMLIRCQGGLYVKELITGDGGRTSPSVTEITNVPSKCVELDVTDVCVGEPAE